MTEANRPLQARLPRRPRAAGGPVEEAAAAATVIAPAEFAGEETEPAPTSL